jgi:DNA-binding CsgD family transcriptional regulator
LYGYALQRRDHLPTATHRAGCDIQVDSNGVERHMTSSKEMDAFRLLSHREQEVLRHTAAGYTSLEIGETLRISPKTVDTYRARLAKKLGISHRSELVRFAVQVGMLQP